MNNEKPYTVLPDGRCAIGVHPEQVIVASEEEAVALLGETTGVFKAKFPDAWGEEPDEEA